jgi:LacI family transcriptional regulator
MTRKPTPSPGPHKRPTLADVARRAGCSTALVSKVVNGSNSNCGASAKRAEAIQRAVEDLGYQPSFASQSLARQSTRTIGVYVPAREDASFSDPYESRVLRGVEKACQQHHHDWLAINLAGDAGPKACRRRLDQRRIDGLLLLHVDHDVTWIGPLAEAGSRLAAVNFFGDVPGLHTINFDGAAAVRLAMDHLTGLGHRRIGYLGVLADEGPGGLERADAYRRAMRDAGLSIDERCFIDHANPVLAAESDPRFETGVEGAIAYLMNLDRRHWPTALVCYGDYLALRLLGALHDAGIDVPGQISVVGIDNDPGCELVRPQLTTVNQPLEAMGHAAALHLIQADASTPDLSPELVARASTAAVSARC